ncbi:MAG: ABC transporter ATP-binding protein [Clostridiaceae bacterium]
MGGEAVIKARGLVKKYGRCIVLDHLDLDIVKGEIFGLFGPNGAGKSTLVSILATVCKPTAGILMINGSDAVHQPDKARAVIGLVPQEIALYPMLSGLDNLDFWAGIYGLRGSQKKQRIDEAVSVARLEDRIKDRVSKYSGGMKRRLNIAVSLLHHPEVLLMDEPTVGVDIQSRRYILDALAGLKKEGRTIVFTSHYIDELETLCDRIAVMGNGKILAMGRSADLVKEHGANNLEEVLIRLTDWTA